MDGDRDDDGWPRLTVVRSGTRDRWVLGIAMVLLAMIMVGTVLTLF